MLHFQRIEQRSKFVRVVNIDIGTMVEQIFTYFQETIVTCDHKRGLVELAQQINIAAHLD